MLLYCFIGASARTLISSGPQKQDESSSAENSSEMKSIEENELLIASGILLSFVMIAGITTYIRKELNRILERQEKHKPGERASSLNNNSHPHSGNQHSHGMMSTTDDNNDDGLEMGHSIRSATRRRAA